MLLLFLVADFSATCVVATNTHRLLYVILCPFLPPRPSSSLPPRSRALADNEFTGTEELEFFDAQGIVWSGNSLPSSGVCTDIITSDDGNSVRESTIDGSLPGPC